MLPELSDIVIQFVGEIVDMPNKWIIAKAVDQPILPNVWTQIRFSTAFGHLDQVFNASPVHFKLGMTMEAGWNHCISVHSSKQKFNTLNGLEMKQAHKSTLDGVIAAKDCISVWVFHSSDSPIAVLNDDRSWLIIFSLA